jgi:hypothetical protein
MNSRKVKIFEKMSMQALEDAVNEWLADTGNRVEIISYSASRDAYSALVFYRYLPPPIEDEYRTEPLP